MTRKRTAASDQPKEQPRLTVSRAQLEQELNERIRVGEELKEHAENIDTAEELEAAKADYYTWTEYNTELLKQRFTTIEVSESYGAW